MVPVSTQMLKLQPQESTLITLLCQSHSLIIKSVQSKYTPKSPSSPFPLPCHGSKPCVLWPGLFTTFCLPASSKRLTCSPSPQSGLYSVDQIMSLCLHKAFQFLSTLPPNHRVKFIYFCSSNNNANRPPSILTQATGGSPHHHFIQI